MKQGMGPGGQGPLGEDLDPKNIQAGGESREDGVRDVYRQLHRLAEDLTGLSLDAVRRHARDRGLSMDTFGDFPPLALLSRLGNLANEIEGLSRGLSIDVKVAAARTALRFEANGTANDLHLLLQDEWIANALRFSPGPFQQIWQSIPVEQHDGSRLHVKCRDPYLTCSLLAAYGAPNAARTLYTVLERDLFQGPTYVKQALYEKLADRIADLPLDKQIEALGVLSLPNNSRATARNKVLARCANELSEFVLAEVSGGRDKVDQKQRIDKLADMLDLVRDKWSLDANAARKAVHQGFWAAMSGQNFGLIEVWRASRIVKQVLELGFGSGRLTGRT